MQAARRVVFNPTGLPGLKPSRVQTRDLYSSGFSLKIWPGATKSKGIGRYTGIRRFVSFEDCFFFARRYTDYFRASLQAGENESGHISAGANEGILFFDSKPQTASYFILLINKIYRYISLEIKLAPVPTTASRQDPTRSAEKIQSPSSSSIRPPYLDSACDSFECPNQGYRNSAESERWVSLKSLGMCCY